MQFATAGLWRFAWKGLLLVGLAGALVFFYPLDVKIDRVRAQSVDPLPEVLRQALRYSLSEDGSDSAVRFEAAKILAADLPGFRLNLGLWPALLSARLLVFSQVTQSERLVMETYQPRCWTAGIETTTDAEALYLAARTRSPSMQDPPFIRDGMQRIGQRLVNADVITSQVLVDITNAALPDCERNQPNQRAFIR
jgi:hypothetical protein